MEEEKYSAIKKVVEYTAEEYLKRIENTRLNSTPLYSRKEMTDFAEKYAKAITATPCCKSNSEQLSNHKCKFYVNTECTYLKCECGKRIKPSED